jgi:hypothetical protein
VTSLALAVHIAGGTVALGAGAAALCFRKGTRAHAKAGTLFFWSMLVLFVSGGGMAVALGLWNIALSAVFGLYLIATSWATARRRDGLAGRFELVAFLTIASVAAIDLTLGLVAQSSASGRLFGYPAGPYFVFAGLSALAGGLDLNFILRRGVSQAQRIARHLWRICAALLFTAFSFFVGQQKIMPTAWHGSFWLWLPPLAVIGAMIFWVLRVRFSAAYSRRQPGRAAGSRPAPAQA